jgi:hypothetical protein
MTEELLALLKLFESVSMPLTARKIATKTKTYPATALRRVEALATELKKDNRNPQIKKTQVREGRRGPPSVAWRLE